MIVSGGDLRALRTARGISQSRLAGMIGVSKVSVWKWERGDSAPRRRNLAALADALQVPDDDLQIGFAAWQFSGDGASSRSNLADLIEQVKRHLARIAGVDATNITITIDY